MYEWHRGFHENKVASTQRPGHQAHKCKMGDSHLKCQTQHKKFPILGLYVATDKLLGKQSKMQLPQLPCHGQGSNDKPPVPVVAQHCG